MTTFDFPPFRWSHSDFGEGACLKRQAARGSLSNQQPNLQTSPFFAIFSDTQNMQHIISSENSQAVVVSESKTRTREGGGKGARGERDRRRGGKGALNSSQSQLNWIFQNGLTVIISESKTRTGQLPSQNHYKTGFSRAVSHTNIPRNNVYRIGLHI
jgi:hypothetical protein